jgi:hypothetical protein
MRRWVESCMVVGHGSLHMLESQRAEGGHYWNTNRSSSHLLLLLLCYAETPDKQISSPISLSLNQTHSRRHT